MPEEESRKFEEVHKAYELCKKVFAPGFDIMDVAVEIEDKEEYEFCKLVHEHFLQKKQRKLYCHRGCKKSCVFGK